MANKTALVVDDSFTMRNMVSLALKEQSFDVVTAEDGIDALKVSKGKKFDVIITDINMPNMNGFELLPSSEDTGIEDAYVNGLISQGEKMVILLDADYLFDKKALAAADSASAR